MKLRFLLFIAFCMGQVFLFAQESIPRFRLELSNQSILSQGDVLVVAPNIDFPITNKTYNYASHFWGFWRLGNRLELGVGLGYANRDAYVLDDFCFNAPCRRPSGYFTDGYTRIRSLEIPLELRWKYWKSAKRIIPYVSVGIANRIPVTKQSFYGREKTRLSLGDYSMGVVLGTGVQFNFFEKWSLNFATQIRKDSNFRFEQRSSGNRWINEAVLKIGVGRSF